MFPNLGPPQKRLIMPGGKPDFGPLLFCLGSSALQSRRPFFFGQGSFFSYFFHPDPGVSRGIPIPMEPTSPVRPDEPRLGHEGKGSAQRLDEPTVSTWRFKFRWRDRRRNQKTWENVRRQTVEWIFSSIPIGSMYSIYGNMYHQYTPNVSIYTSTMDPMAFIIHLYIGVEVAKTMALFMM